MTAGVHVQVTDLDVSIGERRILDGVTVAFVPGTVTAVVGPSGSGKTTLFNVLARLRAPASGQVEIDAVPIRTSSARIALVHQTFALLSLLTAAENVELAAQIDGRPRGDVLVDAQRCLAAVDLAERAHHLIEELSGGEQQRVAFARAMITDPQLLLADEPTAQLDPANREHVIALLRTAADDGATVLVATHDPEVAATCDEVVTLHSGRVASPHESAGRHRQL